MAYGDDNESGTTLDARGETKRHEDSRHQTTCSFANFVRGKENLLFKLILISSMLLPPIVASANARE